MSAARSLWSENYRWVSLGAVALVFLAAIQSLAVTTVMPVVSADLDGEALYAVAFAGTLATSVIGMVVTGFWSDRSGPTAPLYAAVALFATGLLIAGFADTMEVLVLGRLIQGLGIGGQTVALYVVVARVYPPELHGRVFALFSAAWVVPSLIGPFLAGAVAEYLHWRWVFLGVAVLTVIAFILVATRLRGVDLSPSEQSGTSGSVARRLGLAIVVAALAVALSLTGRITADYGAVIGWVIAGATLVILAIAVRPLLPQRTLLAGRGLPAVIVMRGLVAGTLFGAEVYVPLLLTTQYGFGPTMAGLALTVAAIAWAVAAEVQGRFGDRLGNERITVTGLTLLSFATIMGAVTALLHLPAWVLIASWMFAGGGVGLIYPRLTVLTLAYSTTENQGFNSAALSISDSLGSSAAIALMGLIFISLGSAGLAFGMVFIAATLLAALALVPGLRMTRSGTMADGA
ncbi:MFS transporter [Microbacterium sp. YY-03]|uniref:MFS transporter n=1 Tax=Microbacterium sp. YY-03 TaxID=3421636 RepID=UPI003D17C344